MRALIFGGRDWDNQRLMDSVLNGLHAKFRFAVIINGGQVSRQDGYLFGADHQAAVWASKNRIRTVYFYANWHAEGKKAGPLRNQRMIDEGRPDIGIMFPGGSGTKDMAKRLEKAGIKVVTAPVS